MTASAKAHALLGLRRTAECCRAGGKEDPWGFLRGPHNEGLQVCVQYQAPKLAALTEETLVDAYNCTSCKRSMHEHLQIDTALPKSASRPFKSAAAAQPVASVALPSTISAPSHVQWERDAQLLDERNDPLAINAPKSPPPQPPRQPPPAAHDNSSRAISDADAFKLEVERMVREANAKEGAYASGATGTGGSSDVSGASRWRRDVVSMSIVGLGGHYGLGGHLGWPRWCICRRRRRRR